MKKLLIACGFALLGLTQVAHAMVSGLTVGPTKTQISATVRVQALVPASANPRTTPIDRALSPGSRRPVLRGASNGVALTWRMNCSVGFDTFAPQGIFQIDGKTIATADRLGNNCPSTPTTLNERVDIPSAVSDAVLERVLSRPVSTLGSGGRFTEIVTVTFSRRFSDIDPASVSRTVSFFFRVTVLAGFDDISVDESQLVAVKGTASGSFQSFVQATTRPSRVTWNADIESVGEGSRLTVVSDRIQFRTSSGQVLQTLPKRLSQIFQPRLASINTSQSGSVLSALGDLLIPALNAQPAKRSTLRFNETIAIPPNVVAAAKRAGSGRLQIVRVFTDGRNRVEAVLDFALGGQASADFQVTRIDIRFTGGERLKVIEEDEPLQLIADINYVGTGLLRATWEVAPVAAAGRAFFRPLPPSTAVLPAGDFSGNSFGTRQTRTLVRQYLNSFQRASFRSPVLPTRSVGQYLVRLRIDSPDLLFEPPVIEYFVGTDVDSGVASVLEVVPITIEAPADGGELQVGSTLRWSPVGLTTAYRYELYAEADANTDMISGAVIPGKQSQATLSALVADRLTNNRDYWWRVVAIDDKGLEHGVSDVRRVRVVGGQSKKDAE